MIPLFTPSGTYKPFRYPWAHDFWKIQQQVHWMPEEVPLGEDIKDWERKLSPEERNLLTQIFRYFTQSDVEVSDNYNTRLLSVFKPTEVQMMLTSFANMETIHITAYALMLETIGMPETEFQAFRDYDEMRSKSDYLSEFNTETPEDTLITLATFGAFVEGLSLFASFAMLMNFPRFNKMKGMGQIVSWSVRDESLHCEGIIKLYNTLKSELKGEVNQEYVDSELVAICDMMVSLEDRFIDLAFEMGPVQGMTADDIKQYIRYIADWRLGQLGLKPMYGVTTHPIPWLTEILNGVEHANFFEQRATEYSKGALTGSWENAYA